MSARPHTSLGTGGGGVSESALASSRSHSNNKAQPQWTPEKFLNNTTGATGGGSSSNTGKSGQIHFNVQTFAALA